MCSTFQPDRPSGRKESIIMSQSINAQTPKNAAVEAETPPALSAEDVVAQLRNLKQHIGEMTPLTKLQRKTLARHAGLPNNVVQASINALGASADLQQALGHPADDVRQMAEDANRWTAVEDELRAMLKGIAGANLIRRQRVGLLSVQAYVMTQQLARDPNNAGLLPHVEEIKRLRGLGRRKKTATPAPQPSPAPAPLPHLES
ncbi:MAG TPA: hypothetical protein VGQ46_18765 [Thermoanaerobaculia bacterium]|jgi:hypothetical protein|nr:hypothetical protein [Thermoanaerobaculia bacterium]